MARLVARWERSGLTQAAFARQCGMSVHTLTWWRWRLRSAPTAPTPRASTPTFTEVVLTAPPIAGAVAEVVLRNGWVVRVPLAGVDAAAVRTLVRALDAPC
jgi:transposase-like protein